MAEQTILLCDNDKCSKPGTSYYLWTAGATEAIRVDLCDQHASSLLRLMELGTPESLPKRSRSVMEITPLKTTKNTKPYKV